MPNNFHCGRVYAYATNCTSLQIKLKNIEYTCNNYGLQSDGHGHEEETWNSPFRNGNKTY